MAATATAMSGERPRAAWKSCTTTLSFGGAELPLPGARYCAPPAASSCPSCGELGHPCDMMNGANRIRCGTAWHARHVRVVES